MADEYTESIDTTEATESFTDSESVETATDAAPPEADALDDAPDVPVAPPYEAFDPSTLPDEAAPAYTALRSDYDALTGFKAEAEPILSWVNERGGQAELESDLGLVTAVFSEDADTRATFHQKFYEQSPVAYQRFVDDLIDDQNVQVAALHKLGLDPALIETYRQIAADGTINGQSVQVEAPPVPEFVATLKPELQAVFKSLPRKVQEDYALRDPEVAEWDLQQVAAAQAEKARQQQAAQQQQAERAQARQAQIAEQQKLTYTGARNAVKESLAKAFEGDALLPDIIASAVETEYFDSEQGAAQWARMADLIARGETRTVKAELPLMIAQVKALATQKAKHLESIYSDARKWRASQQQENPRTEPRRGEPVGNGRDTMRPAGAGEYRPENILNYWANASRGQ